MLSQNGYPVSSAAIGSYPVPGTGETIRIRRGDTATVLLYVAARFNAEVEPLAGDPHDEWGYAVRDIRGSTTAVSNHASGTAIDLNAAEHPLGTDPRSSFSRKQIKAIHRIVADCGGVVRWGGDYTGRKDPMHWEINASPARVAALAKAIRGEDDMAGPEFVAGSYQSPQTLTHGKWTTLTVQASGPSFLAGPKDIAGGTLHLTLADLPPGATVQVEFYLVKPDGKGGWKAGTVVPTLEVDGSTGQSFRQFVISGHVPAGQRLRARAAVTADTATVSNVSFTLPTWKA